MSEKSDNNDESVDLFELVDSICDEFRRQWKSGQRPRISEFVARAPKNGASQLFRLLLPIDIRYRTRVREKPSANDYLGLFPQFRKFINDAFHPSASFDLDSKGEVFQAHASDVAATVESPAVNRLGDYDVASALARSGDLSQAWLYLKRANELLANERFFLTEAIRAGTNGFVCLQSSCYDRARQFASFGWELVASTWLVSDFSLLCLPILIESIAGSNWTSPLEVESRKLAKKMIRRANLLYRSHPNHQSHIQRVVGRAAMALGNNRKAISKFEKAARLSKRKGMDFQRAKSLLDLAAVKEERRDENRAEAIALLKKMESVIPRADSWLLGDQYDDEVVAPEFDLAAWEAENGRVTPERGEDE